MGEALGRISVPKAALKGFEKTKINSTTFYVADCVAYTPGQLGATSGRAAKKSGRLATTKAAEKSDTPRWQGGIVPYRYVSSFTANEKSFFEKAGKMWTDAAGNGVNGPVLQFVEDAGETHPKHVAVSKITKKMNKASNGAIDGAFIQIGFLDVGSIAHELGHVLGLVHEHQRSDRDDFVTVGSAVKGDPNFRKHSASEDAVRTEYDFESIMHYGAKVLLNGAAVDALTPKPPFAAFSSKMGQRKKISDKDRQAIRAMYKA